MELTKQQWGALVLALLLIIFTAISVVSSTHRSREAFTELQKMKKQERELQVLYGQLLLQQSALAIPANIEKQAIKKLNMQEPQAADMFMFSQQ